MQPMVADCDVLGCSSKAAAGPVCVCSLRCVEVQLRCGREMAGSRTCRVLRGNWRVRVAHTAPHTPSGAQQPEWRGWREDDKTQLVSSISLHICHHVMVTVYAVW